MRVQLNAEKREGPHVPEALFLDEIGDLPLALQQLNEILSPDYRLLFGRLRMLACSGLEWQSELKC